MADVTGDRDGEVMTREARLARSFVEIADTLVADFDVVDLHTLLANRSVEIFEVDAAGLMVISPAGDLRVMAASDEGVRKLELFELQAEEGPCFDCLWSGEALVNQDLAAKRATWPNFADVALQQGFSTAHALPMRLRSRVIGALNLFQADGQLDEDDISSAQAMADIATIAILHNRARIDAEVLNDQLDQALTSRVVIEQAKGMLAGFDDLTMDEAFRRLRSYSRANNLRLADVARSVTEGSLGAADLRPASPGKHY